MLSGTTADNTDAGAIYLNDRWPAKSTNIKVTNNFVRDAGYSGLAKGLGDFCFYLDDEVSNITLSQNICAGTWTSAVFYHAGQNAAIESIDRIIGETPVGEQERVHNRLADTLRCVISQKLIPSLDGKRVMAKEVMLGIHPFVLPLKTIIPAKSTR